MLFCKRLILPVIVLELIMLVVGSTCDSGVAYYVSSWPYL